MRKYKINYSDESRKDIQNIFNFVEAISSEENAKLVAARFIKKIRSFSLFPERNEIFAEDKNGLPLRATISGKYRIVYIVKKKEKEVIIARIISISQDLNKIIK